MRALFVSEFGPGLVETMTEDLISGLSALDPSLKSRFFHGFLPRYVEGGMSPVRILNVLYMYAALPIVMLSSRSDVVVARTTPPCIQLWACLLGLILRVRVVGWIMDYHPEIEAKAIARHRTIRWLAPLLRAMDSFFLRRLDFAIVLDDAMEQLVQSRAPDLPLIQHPTWNGKPGLPHKAGPEAASFAETGELCLAYAGNLGYSHPLEAFEALLAEFRRSGTIHLIAIGVSKSGEARLRSLAERTGIRLEILPRTPFADLGRLFEEHRVHMGLVFLSDQVAGLVSPSKFGAYVRFGIPILYIGPAGTSSEAVCLKFGAGFVLRNRATLDEVAALASRLRDVEEMATARGNTRAAAEYFCSRNGDTLARAIAPRLLRDLR